MRRLLVARRREAFQIQEFYVPINLLVRITSLEAPRDQNLRNPRAFTRPAETGETGAEKLRIRAAELLRLVPSGPRAHRRCVSGNFPDKCTVLHKRNAPTASTSPYKRNKSLPFRENWLLPKITGPVTRQERVKSLQTGCLSAFICVHRRPFSFPGVTALWRSRLSYRKSAVFVRPATPAGRICQPALMGVRFFSSGPYGTCLASFRNLCATPS
jgi:hypothetical protein